MSINDDIAIDGAIAYACRGQCAPFSSRCWECCGLIIAPCSHLAKISMFGKEIAQEQALSSAVYNNPKRSFFLVPFLGGGSGVQGALRTGLLNCTSRCTWVLGILRHLEGGTAEIRFVMGSGRV